MILPTKGSPFGPGGNGMEFFRRLNHAHASIAVIITKAVPIVGLKAMLNVRNCWLKSTLRVSKLMSRYDTLRRGDIGVAACDK